MKEGIVYTSTAVCCMYLRRKQLESTQSISSCFLPLSPVKGSGTGVVVQEQWRGAVPTWRTSPRVCDSVCARGHCCSPPLKAVW